MTDTYQEARLIVELSRWGTEMGLDDALTHLFSDDFDPDSANVDDPAVRTTLAFFETVGALVKRGALSGDLVRDVWWISGLWPRVASHAQFAREDSHEPTLYENFEALLTL